MVQILENLALSALFHADYELIAWPMKLEGRGAALWLASNDPRERLWEGLVRAKTKKERPLRGAARSIDA